MVAIKPHTAVVRASTAVVLGDQLEGWEIGDAKSVAGQFTPISPMVADRDYGVQVKNPHLFLCDVTPETNGIAHGWKVEIFGEKYSVAHVARFRGIGLADHCQIVVGSVLG